MILYNLKDKLSSHTWIVLSISPMYNIMDLSSDYTALKMEMLL
jgi:hypothetical protein